MTVWIICVIPAVHRASNAPYLSKSCGPIRWCPRHWTALESSICPTGGSFRECSTIRSGTPLTGRRPGYGIKDVDLFYFDTGDLSYEAEDAVIRRACEVFANLPVPVEARNQARVHLWYERRFGSPCPRLRSCRESIDRFASKTHAVGVHVNRNGEFEVYAPHGLDDIFSFSIVPNRTQNNEATHIAKAMRAKANWPEITVIPW